MHLSEITLFFCLVSVCAASLVTVQVQSVTVEGVYNETTGVDMFRGIYYGHAERFRRTAPVNYTQPGTVNATFFGVACPQIKGTNSLAVNYGVYGTDEDCTLLDIYRPHGDSDGELLPVMLWLHGGALTQGAASHYPGDGIVQRSVSMGQRVITVIINYRLAAWGFLGGKEAAENGALNLGLYDQKAALQWVQSYIQAFGGDPSKVTIFGQSSGAMSIAYHMLDVNTKLFRGAILESGTMASVPALPSSAYQGNYDTLVSIAGCGNSTNSFDCLRTMDRDALIAAMNTLFGQPTLYGSRPWGVAIDGEIIPGIPSILATEGKIANVPFITGDVLDEGTIYVKPQQLNDTLDLLNFLQKDYLNRGASFFQNVTSVLTTLILYPNIPALGSPYHSGDQTFFGPQFKRAAAIYGDIHFHSPRRDFLSMAICKGMQAWSYIFDQPPPGVAAWQGVYHTSEIPFVFMQIDPSDNANYALAQQMSAYWIAFANNLNPNHPGNPQWASYASQQNLYVTVSNATMQADVFRKFGTSFISSISNQLLAPKQ